jgi:threonine aldolase
MLYDNFKINKKLIGGNNMLFFRNDYGNGAHPIVMDALCKTNLELTSGYGTDSYCQNATNRIRKLCNNSQADVHFIVGGTQANKTAIGAFLRSWEAVITADTGHIQVHEAGAVEHNGHRLITITTPDGKLSPEHISQLCSAYQKDETSPEPKLVYISNTTELGTVYTKAELRALREACDQWGLYLYCDGARLAAAMAVSDIDLPDYASLCHAFTIGGTKNGLLFGEALVITEPSLMPSFRRCMKQQGAMLAKGRLLGVQFDTVLENGLYQQLGRKSTETAKLLADGMEKFGIPMLINSPSNQLFPILSNDTIEELSKSVSFEHWSQVDATRSCIRFVTAWHTTKDEVNELLALLQQLTC